MVRLMEQDRPTLVQAMVKRLVNRNVDHCLKDWQEHPSLQLDDDLTKSPWIRCCQSQSLALSMCQEELFEMATGTLWNGTGGNMSWSETAALSFVWMLLFAFICRKNVGPLCVGLMSSHLSNLSWEGFRRSNCLTALQLLARLSGAAVVDEHCWYCTSHLGDIWQMPANFAPFDQSTETKNTINCTACVKSPHASLSLQYCLIYASTIIIYQASHWLLPELASQPYPAHLKILWRLSCACNHCNTNAHVQQSHRLNCQSPLTGM